MGQVEVRLGQVKVMLSLVEVRLGQVEVMQGLVEVRLGLVEVRLGQVEVMLGLVEVRLGQVGVRLRSAGSGSLPGTLQKESTEDRQPRARTHMEDKVKLSKLFSRSPKGRKLKTGDSRPQLGVTTGWRTPPLGTFWGDLGTSVERT